MEESNVEKELRDTETKLGIMRILKCGSIDVDWLLSTLLPKFSIPVETLTMYGITFNDIVRGIYLSALKKMGVVYVPEDVIINADMSNSHMTVKGVRINSLDDLQQFSMIDAQMGNIGNNRLESMMSSLNQELENKFKSFSAITQESLKSLKQEIFTHIDSKFNA